MNIPIWPIIGGIMIGSSAVLLMYLLGRTAGISSILWNAVATSSRERLWQVLFILGLALGAYMFHAIAGTPYPKVNLDPQLAIAAGLLVGVGVKLGNGCTSGHGVCGIGRLSPRSFVATAVFMTVAMVTVWAVRTIPLNSVGA
jgi:hypothetical protein